MRSTKIIKICSSSLWTCLHHMVILRSQNKITDFSMILAWASPFKKITQFRRTNNNESLEEYKETRNNFRKLCKEKKCSYGLEK